MVSKTYFLLSYFNLERKLTFQSYLFYTRNVCTDSNNENTHWVNSPSILIFQPDWLKTELVCPCCWCCLSVCPVLIYLRTNAWLPRDTTQIRADNNFYKQNKDKNGVVAGLIIAAVRWQKINYRLTERQSVPLFIPWPSPGPGGSSASKILPAVVTSNQYEDSGQEVPRVLIASEEFEWSPPASCPVQCDEARGLFTNDLLINMKYAAWETDQGWESPAIFIVCVVWMMSVEISVDKPHTKDKRQGSVGSLQPVPSVADINPVPAG